MAEPRPPLVYLTNTPLEIPASSRPNNIDARMSRKDGSVQVHRIPRIASPTQARHRAHQSVRIYLYEEIPPLEPLLAKPKAFSLLSHAACLRYDLTGSTRPVSMYTKLGYKGEPEVE